MQAVVRRFSQELPLRKLRTQRVRARAGWRVNTMTFTRLAFLPSLSQPTSSIHSPTHNVHLPAGPDQAPPPQRPHSPPRPALGLDERDRTTLRPASEPPTRYAGFWRWPGGPVRPIPSYSPWDTAEDDQSLSLSLSGSWRSLRLSAKTSSGTLTRLLLPSQMGECMRRTRRHRID